MKDLFSSKLGGEIYASALRAIDDHRMLDHMKRGVLVGFSGGADSARQIKLRTKPSTGQWFLWEQFLLADIRKPVSADPWA